MSVKVQIIDGDDVVYEDTVTGTFSKYNAVKQAVNEYFDVSELSQSSIDSNICVRAKSLSGNVNKSQRVYSRNQLIQIFSSNTC